MTRKRPAPEHSDNSLRLPTGYPALLEDIKARIRSAQIRAALSVNRELIQLYWDIGRAIVLRQRTERWGAKVIDRLADDLQHEFPGLAGFSRTNVYRMRSFYLAYADDPTIVPRPVGRTARPIVPQPAGQLPHDGPPCSVGQLPWGHNVVLLEKLDESSCRLWYAQQAIANGWSRSMLEHWVESDLYSRQGKAVTNFKATLPPPQSDLAQQVIKDPYNSGSKVIAEYALRHLQRPVGVARYVTRLTEKLPRELADKLPTIRQIEAGLAAAMAAAQNQSPQQIDGKSLNKALRDRGVHFVSD